MRRSDDARVALRGLTKRFGAFLAVDGVDLAVRAGTIHGLVGENGAGKSTCMKMLYGLVQPTAGDILLDGMPCVWSSPLDAIAAGVGMVHQHFMLDPEHTVLDNVLLGAESLRRGLGFLPRSLRPIDRAGAAREVAAVASQYGLEVPLDALVETLPVGLQQRVEILKALYRRARVLILDEPTAVLTPLETKELFRNLRRLADEGCSIVIITHKLEEVLALCDDVSVLRQGRIVGHADPKTVTVDALASMMVGKDVTLHIPVAPGAASGAPVLALDGVSHVDPKRLADVSLVVGEGEIVGIAGVEGNGQSELIDVVLDPRRAAGKGTVRIAGRDATRMAPRAIRDLGVGFVPQDRHAEGLLLGLPASDNCLLGHEHGRDVGRFGVLSRRAVLAKARRLFDEFDVRPRAVERLAKDFSGGNQQKLIFGRELAGQPKLLVCARPTRGVDVGAIEQIHRRLVAERDRGAGVLLVSSDLDEVLTLSDRILVVFGGRVVAEHRRGAVTLEQLGVAMGGGHA